MPEPRLPPLDQYYSQHRQRWEDLYPSERWIFERITPDRVLGRVLDVGCAVGGVGRALAEHFAIAAYAGLDVDPRVVAAARRREFPVPATFSCADIVAEPVGDTFDTVIALAAADWATNTREMLDACWSRVAPGGRFVMSLRLTAAPTMANASLSYQRVETAEGGETRMPYTVLNVDDALGMCAAFSPAASRVLGYGYRGSPSASAVTPFTSVVFAVFSVERAIEPLDAPAVDLHLPLDLWRPSR